MNDYETIRKLIIEESNLTVRVYYFIRNEIEHSQALTYQVYKTQVENILNIRHGKLKEILHTLHEKNYLSMDPSLIDSQQPVPVTLPGPGLDLGQVTDTTTKPKVQKCTSTKQDKKQSVKKHLDESAKKHLDESVKVHLDESVKVHLDESAKMHLDKQENQALATVEPDSPAQAKPLSLEELKEKVLAWTLPPNQTMESNRKKSMDKLSQLYTEFKNNPQALACPELEAICLHLHTNHHLPSIRIESFYNSTKRERAEKQNNCN